MAASVKKWTPSVEEVAILARAEAEGLSREDQPVRTAVSAGRIRHAGRVMLDPRKPVIIWEDDDGPHYLGDAFDILGWEGGTSDAMDELVHEVLVSMSADSEDGLGNPLGLAKTNPHYNLISQDPDVIEYPLAYFIGRIKLVVNRARSLRLKGAAIYDPHDREDDSGLETRVIRGLASLGLRYAPSAEEVAFDGDLQPHGVSILWVPPTVEGRHAVERLVDEYVGEWEFFRGLGDAADLIWYIERQLGRNLTDPETVETVREFDRARAWWEGETTGRAFLAETIGVDPEHEDFTRRVVCISARQQGGSHEAALDRHRRRVAETAFPLVDESRRTREALRRVWTWNPDTYALDRAVAARLEAREERMKAWERIFTREETTLPGLGLEDARRLYDRCEVCLPPERECDRDGCDVIFRPDHGSGKLCGEHAAKSRTLSPREKVLKAGESYWEDGGLLMLPRRGGESAEEG